MSDPAVLVDHVLCGRMVDRSDQICAQTPDPVVTGSPAHEGAGGALGATKATHNAGSELSRRSDDEDHERSRELRSGLMRRASSRRERTPSFSYTWVR